MTLAPYLAGLCAVAASVLSSIYLALSISARSAVEEAARVGGEPRRLARVQRIFDDLGSHARAVGLLKLLACAGVLTFVVSATAKLRGRDTPDEVDALIGLSGAVAVLWVSAVLIPFSVATHHGPKVLVSLSRLVRFADVVLLPLRPLGLLADRVAERFSSTANKDEQEVAQDEILSVVADNVSAGAIDEQEKRMIEAVVTFGDVTVREVMTPRTEIEAMALSSDLGQVIRAVRAIGHSRIPVYEGSLDHVVGMFYVKDLMHWLAGDAPGPVTGAAGSTSSGGMVGPSALAAPSIDERGGVASQSARPKPRSFDLRSILRPALTVPETKTIRELLRQLMEQKVHIAIAVDEHGNTAGVVTFEDIVEQIVGEIRDEYEQGETEQSAIVLDKASGIIEINATARVEVVNASLREFASREAIAARQATSVDEGGLAEGNGDGRGEVGASASGDDASADEARILVQIPEADDYETIGGYVVTMLGHIPLAGEKLRSGDAEFEVVEAAPTRIIKLRMRLIAESSDLSDEQINVTSAPVA